jgi:hypothetical protein
MLKRHTAQLLTPPRTVARFLAFPSVANHINFYPALLSHFPDERATVPGPQPYLPFGWGFHLAASLAGRSFPFPWPDPGSYRVDDLGATASATSIHGITQPRRIRPMCSQRMRRGAWRRTLPSCRSCDSSRGHRPNSCPRTVSLYRPIRGTRTSASDGPMDR